jgi:putative sporulation protein YyaC
MHMNQPGAADGRAEGGGALAQAGEVRRVRYDDPCAVAVLGAALAELLTRCYRPGEEELALLCVGTDRSTGDALGPLVGRGLEALHPRGLRVYGTLDAPVHASNLTAALQSLTGPVCLVAVDACLGRLETVGQIAVAEGPLLPGAGVNKQLPPVGRVHITGTVNVGGFMEYFVLQNTRLSLVVRMAEVIAQGVALAVGALPVAAQVASASAP